MLRDMEHASPPAASPRTHGAHFDPRSQLAADMASLMRYKRWADADLLNAAIALPTLARLLLGRYLTKIIRHFHTVDCIFKAHLLGIPHQYSSPNPAEPATLTELRQRVNAVDEWYLEYARNADERVLAEALDVTFTDGQQQVLTRSDILLHVSLHGAYHRGNAGILLRIVGTEPLPDRFTSYLRAHAADA